MTSRLNSPSPGRTFDIGKKIGRCLQGNEIILLCGELGAGKTLLTKGIADSLGIDPDEVVSPTFTLLNRYEFPGRKIQHHNGSMDSWLIHFDCYRLADLVAGNGPAPAISRPGEEKCQGRANGLVLPEIDDWLDLAVVVIEWAQYLHLSYFNLDKTVSIRIDIISDQRRRISIDSRLAHIRI